MERQEASEQREREEQEQRDEQEERKESLCWEWRPVKGRWERALGGR